MEDFTLLYIALFAGAIFLLMAVAVIMYESREES